MSGLYIHIPFCKRRCIYCGFFSTTLLERRQQYVDALCQEMRMRLSPDVTTVYLGGGTPSVLSAKQLQQVFDTVIEVYGVDSTQSEITMECNPDDVDDYLVQTLGALPVNRVSMGVQSFSDERLRFLHRRHSAAQASEAVRRLRKVGIGNISIDLMFGFPGQTLDQWHDDLRMALQLDVEHISAYSLMYEEGTPLYEMLMRHEVEEIDEQKYIIMYKTLVEMLKAAGYEHYEISNFARPGKRSRHNSSYWTDTPYLGIGAGAHSYDGTCRMSHVTDVGQYIAAINQGILPEETELLSADERYNDMVTTAMRTAEGISISELTQKFGQQKTDYLLKNAQKALYNQWLVLEDDRLHLTLQGIMVSDSVMSDLMMV